jgi:hypothetical protein
VIETTIPWAVVLLKFSAALAAGIVGFVGLFECVPASFDNRKTINTRALVISCALLVFGGCAAFVQLGKPASIMSVARNISSGSAVSLEFGAFVACLIVTLVSLYVTQRDSSAKKVVGIVAMVVAGAVGFTGGWSHQAMLGMSAWHSPTVSCAFLSSALVAGGFVYVSLVALSTGVSRELGTGPLHKMLRKMAVILAGLSLLSAACVVANGLMVPFGEHAVLYGVLVVVCGSLVPVGCALLAWLRPSPLWLYLGCVGALFGAFGVRATIWLATNAGLSKALESAMIILT